jgi:hypothetical protein
MSDRVNRFLERKALHTAQADSVQLSLVVTSGATQIKKDVETALLVALKAIDTPAEITVTNAEVKGILGALSDEHAQVRFNDMIAECKRSIISSIAGPFGVGGLVSAFDKVGGNVDTIHNVRKGVWATDVERENYQARGEYDSTPYHSHDGYKERNAEVSKSYNEGSAVDSYTGERFVQGVDKTNLDHIISAKETHDDAAIYLADLKATDLANQPDNLEPTEESINKSKKQDSAEVFIARLERQREERQLTISSLEAKETLTVPESKKLAKLKKLEKVDAERLREADKQAREDRDQKVNDAYYGSRKFALNTLKTSAAEGAKIGLQQAIGVALTEFFIASIDEARDWHSGGRRDLALARRLKRIANRVAKRWKDILSAGMVGVLSGFLSNLATIMINVFLTTQKRMVRMIREGLFSFVHALKMIVTRPDKMTLREAMHEASKLVLAGGIVVGGVMLEEVILRQLQALGLGLVADLATAAIIGSIVAIAIALSAYTIDRLDLLGVQEEKRQTHIIERLDANIHDSIERFEGMLLRPQTFG